MKKLAAVLVLVGIIALSVAPPAFAGASTDAALALGAFAVFNQLVTGQTVFHNVYAPPPVVYAPPAPVYAGPPVVYAPGPPVVYAPPPAVIVRPAPPVYVHPRWGWGHRADWKHHSKHDRHWRHHR
jgi:hypothetical protein